VHHGIGIQEIGNQYQRNKEEWYIFVLRGITNFYAALNNGLIFKIKPGEVCATGIELPHESTVCVIPFVKEST
jgi:hypothetical protein